MHASAPAKRTLSARSLQGALSRERILDAAVDLMGERGYSATSVDALCRKAGIVKTALYWHFGSKEGVLAAALERVGDEWIEEVKKSLSPAGTAEEQLERMIGGIREAVEHRPRHVRMFLAVLLERGESDHATRRTLERIFRSAVEAIAESVEQSVGCRVPDADLIAHNVLTMTQGTALRHIIDPEGVDLDRHFNEIRRTLRLVMADRLREMALGTSAPGAGDVP